MFAETLKGSGTVYNEINFRASATGILQPNHLSINVVAILQSKITILVK